MKGKVYFKNLNGFRFIAAMMVIICHLELFKNRIGQPNSWRFPLIFEAGSAGVDFFFVLSGFLITSLLLLEEQNFGGIDIRKFYVRRILRIWPLYYLVVFICFVIVPHLSIFEITEYSSQLHVNYWPKFLFSLFLMPNAALSFFGEIPYSAPLWSVGVEEQFYLFWPLLLILFRSKLRSIGLFILFFLGIKLLFFVAGMAGFNGLPQYEHWKSFVVATRMECMGIGGIGAYLCVRRSKFRTMITGNGIALAAIILIPLVLFFASALFEMHHLVLSVLFLIIIANGALNQSTFIHLENRIVFTLGAISYGMYVWHSLCIGIAIWVMRQFDFWSSPLWVANAIYYVLALSLTVLVSWTSYFFFERRFLKVKQRYSKLVSGAEARQSNSANKIPRQMVGANEY